MPPSLTHIALSPAAPTASAARAIVAAEAARLPDLSGSVVLLPQISAAPDMSRALYEAAGARVLLLPRITTLAQWTAEVPLDRPVTPRAAREAALYRALSSRGWFEGADLWGVAGELAGLFDELTRHSVALPGDLREFTRQLERAYRARGGAALNFEARVVHELWHAATRPDAEIDPEVAYQLRLSRLSREVTAPLYAVGLGRMSGAERQFLGQASQRVPVTVLECSAHADGDAVASALALAWPAEPGADLRTRAAELRARHPESPLAARLRVFGADDAEREAQAVDVAVREWLLQGRQRIAVVVNDRVVARRARALLERAEVQVRDEAGWAYATTSAATVIGRWLDVSGSDAYHRDLLDLMKSPFAFHDWEREVRRRAVWRLEGYVREAGVVSVLAQFVRLAEDRNDVEVRQMLARLQRAAGLLGRGRRTVSGWLDALDASLAEIGVRAGLAADAAGAQLLELLSGLRDELSRDDTRIEFSEWRRWLAREFEAASFRDADVDSPVLFVSLAATALRRFDAVLLTGCDAAHLPGADPVALFFNQSVRAELGLPTRAEQVRDIEAALSALIAASGTVLMTWQRRVAGEVNLLSPQVERLSALHRLAYGTAFEAPGLGALLPEAVVRAATTDALPVTTAVPAPAADPALLPAQISASGYNALMACPYQFHARYLLRLAELDEVQELIEKRDYGQLVHQVLTEFHRGRPAVRAIEPDAAVAELSTLSDQAFARAIEQNYYARAWLARWKALVPAYVDWQREREAEGWSWLAGEADRRLEITTPAGRRLTLRGRIDRVDTGPDGAVVIDYKLRARSALSSTLEVPGEDVQLPVYALLWGGPVAAALFLSIEREGVKPVAVDGDLTALAEGVRERLALICDQLHDGASLPAQGTDAACEYCEMRGLCRRNYWP